jgi:3-hydroxybutyryl-CoA dehydrogenase
MHVAVLGAGTMSHSIAQVSAMAGHDVRLRDINEELDERFRPPQALKRKGRAGRLGTKTGEGFYTREDGEVVGTSGDWEET